MGSAYKPLPPLADLQRLFTYSPHTGELRYRSGSRRLAGSLKCDAKPYYRVRISGKSYLLHRICWKMQTGKDPVECIDHINGNGLDNRIVNLREATIWENGNNLQREGVRGVHWYKKTNKWMAHIRDGKRKINLGYFHDYSKAVAARKAAEQRLGYL